METPSSTQQVIFKDNIPTTARDILLSKVGEFIIQATQKRASEENEDALSLYQRASEILVALINNETNEEFKAHMEKQLQEINTDKETLEIEHNLSLNTPTSKDSVARRDSTVCEVVMSIDNISVHKILGLGGSDPERSLIGKGLLRILRCQPPPESPKIQSPQVATKSDVEVEQEAKEELATTKQKEGLSLLQLIPVRDDTQFQFPLTKSVPCLCTSPGYYIFPMPGNLFYGIVFPSDIPQAYVNIFEGVLEDCCTMRKIMVHPSFHPSQPPSEPEEKALTTISTSTEIIVAPPESVPLAAKALTAMSSGINTGANALVEGITNGSHIIAATARTGGEFIRKNITPSAEPAKVPEAVTNTVYVAGKLSPVCVAVSKVLISSLAALADEVGKTVAKGLASTKSGKPSSPPGPTVKAAKEMGKTSLQAVVNVWEALEQAGSLLLAETSSVTVGIVDHKYGAEAAQVAKDSMKVTGDILTSAYNFNQLGVKKIAKSAAKRAGKQTVGTLFAGEGQSALPAPEEHLAIEGPPEKLALPAPETTTTTETATETKTPSE